MPFTKHPLQYPICRLLTIVGLAMQSWLRIQPAIRSRWRQQLFEEDLAEHFEFDRWIEEEVIKSYHFKWDRTGKLRKIRLVPHEKVRRTPGIARIKELFYS
jgi:hypothetical protein